MTLRVHAEMLKSGNEFNPEMILRVQAGSRYTSRAHRTQHLVRLAWLSPPCPLRCPASLPHPICPCTAAPPPCGQQWDYVIRGGGIIMKSRGDTYIYIYMEIQGGREYYVIQSTLYFRIVDSFPIGIHAYTQKLRKCQRGKIKSGA
jgi:hypothetical protein